MSWLFYDKLNLQVAHSLIMNMIVAAFPLNLRNEYETNMISTVMKQPNILHLSMNRIWLFYNILKLANFMGISFCF